MSETSGETRPFCVTCSDDRHLAREADGQWRCVDLWACLDRRLALFHMAHSGGSGS